MQDLRPVPSADAGGKVEERGQPRSWCGTQHLILAGGFMSPVFLLAANLNSPGHFVHIGPVQIALANLIVIVLMIVVFVLAIVLPFPRDKR
jgi:hypothetical protein